MVMSDLSFFAMFMWARIRIYDIYIKIPEILQQIDQNLSRTYNYLIKSI
jgi:hypothetical protein